MRRFLSPHIASIRSDNGKSLWPVAGFGISMIVNYGALYYAFTLLAPEISRDLGWDQSFIYAGLSASFFAAGLTAPFTGRWLDRFGGRIVMSWGTAVAALALALVAFAQGPWSFVATVVLAEVAATAALYNAAFATLTQLYGHGARRAITFTTLVAAFSSTIFWPLVSWLLTITDWRGTTLVLAGLMLAISLPIHLLLPAPRTSDERESRTTAHATDTQPTVLEGPARRHAFFLLAFSFSMTGFVLSSMPLHMIPLLTSLGFTGAVAVSLGALVGPSQFLIRFLEMVAGQRFSAVAIGLIAAALVPLGLAILMFGGSSFAAGVLFAVVYGMGQGLESIAKGIVPLALFGTQSYGAILGKLARAGLFVSAGAPWILSLIRESYGAYAALGLSTVIGTLAALAYLGIPKPREVEPT